MLLSCTDVPFLFFACQVPWPTLESASHFG
jgi:hypothetical protein